MRKAPCASGDQTKRKRPAPTNSMGDRFILQPVPRYVKEDSTKSINTGKKTTLKELILSAYRRLSHGGSGMKRRIHYSLYKTGYSQFPAGDYDPTTKTIVVDLPDQPRHQMPKGWVRSGNAYLTPGGCRITVWNSGLARNYLVEHGYCRISTRRSVTIPAGIDSFERMLETVRRFEGG